MSGDAAPAHPVVGDHRVWRPRRPRRSQRRIHQAGDRVPARSV